MSDKTAVQRVALAYRRALQAISPLDHFPPLDEVIDPDELALARAAVEAYEESQPFTAGERRLMEMITALSTKLEKIMTAIDDLNASEANLETVVGALVTDIQSLAGELATAQSSNDSAAIEAVVTKMNALAASGQAILTPPPPPPAAAAA